MPNPPRMLCFDHTFAGVAQNLACDEALLIQAEEANGPPVLRFWEIDHPAVILGASCRLAQNVRLEAVRSVGIPIARRSSGGGTVVIGPGALNVTVVLPIRTEPVAFRSVDTAQQFVLEQVATALRPLGPDVVMLGSGDLTWRGRKFAGSAQRRLRNNLMIHTSLLYDFELSQIDHFLAMPPRQPSYRENRSHADFVTNLALDRALIVKEIARIWGAEVGCLPDDPGLLDLIDDLARRKFGDNGWIERL